MKLYLDTCCWGRPWDGQTSEKVVAEADAVEAILDRRFIHGHVTVGSPVLDVEISENPRAEDRDEIIEFYEDNSDSYIYPSDEDDVRIELFLDAGLGKMDSRHLALAEAAGVGVLLTVDKRFIRKAKRMNLSRVRVINPLTFMEGG